MTAAATTRSLIVLSGSQVAALATGIVGGLITWVLVARILPPSDVGRVAALITMATLISGLVASGLGQYLLAVLPRQAASKRSRSVVVSNIAGVLGTAAVATPVGIAALHGATLQTGILAVFALSVSLTTIQDAVYLCAGSARDIVLKTMAISVLKALLVVVAGLARSGPLTTYDMVVLAMLLPNLVIGSVWLAARTRGALARIPDAPAGQPARSSHLLSIGYLYAFAQSLVAWGIPAIATNVLVAAASALFYVAWTLASILGSVPLALANVIVSRGREAGRALNPSRIVVVETGLAAAAAVGIFVMAPILLSTFGTYYRAGATMLGVLLGAQVMSGTSAVLIGFARRTAGPKYVLVALVMWAVGGFGVPGMAAVFGFGDLPGSFAVGSAIALVLIALLLRSQIVTRVDVVEPGLGCSLLPRAPEAE